MIRSKVDLGVSLSRIIFLKLGGLFHPLFLKFFYTQNGGKQLFKDFFYSDIKEKEPEVCSFKDAIRLAIYRASELIAIPYIRKERDYDSS